MGMGIQMGLSKTGKIIKCLVPIITSPKYHCAPDQYHMFKAVLSI